MYARQLNNWRLTTADSEPIVVCVQVCQSFLRDDDCCHDTQIRNEFQPPARCENLGFEWEIEHSSSNTNFFGGGVIKIHVTIKTAFPARAQ